MKQNTTERSSSTNTADLELPPDVFCLTHLIVNSYLVGDGSGWVVVDAGITPGSAHKIRRTAKDLFGPENRPQAIILTHGHFDHVGAVQQLADNWHVPVYAHRLELPFLTGRADYPEPDPSVGGGLMARMAGFYPNKRINLGGRIHPLPTDSSIPGMPGWRWLHTPGHTPGHVSLFRESDRALIAGDAFITVKQESLLAVLTQRQEVHGPPAYFTPDWRAAGESVRMLLELAPEYAATGHGRPMRGERLRQELWRLVHNFRELAVPAHGRYVTA